MFIIDTAIYIVGALVGFWDKVRGWLNDIVVPFFEKKLGSKVSKLIQKSIVTVDRLVDKLKQTAVIYSKKSRHDLYFTKTTITSEAPLEMATEEVLADFEKHHNKLVQEFVFKD